MRSFVDCLTRTLRNHFESESSDFETDSMTTTQKHQSFVSTPMGGKSVGSVPGVGPASSQRLGQNNITTALQLFGRYLIDRPGFKEWYMGVVGTNRPSDAAACEQALSDYYNNFF